MSQNPRGGSQFQLSRASKVLILIAFNVFVVGLVFGGLEFAMRRRDYALLGPKSQQPRTLRDRYVAWRNNPVFSSVVVQHDAQGFRKDRDVPVEKPPNTIRIFFLGGSTAYGAETSYPEIDGRYSRIYNNQLIDYYLEQELNAALPSRHWEVINAATMEYRLHQQLALIESALLRYRPDYVILMDGYNDVFQISKATTDYDAYAATPHWEEFDALANPQSARSFLFFTSTWLRANSVLYRSLSDHVQIRSRFAERQTAARGREFGNRVRLWDLSPQEQAQFALSLSQIGSYVHVARQIHRILDLDGIKTVFLLQPVLILSHKPFTESEQRMFDYNRRINGPLLTYDYEQLYSKIASSMAAAAAQDGFRFLDLTDLFDSMPDQAFTDYCHLTPAANRLVAEHLFQFLSDSFEKQVR